MKSWLSFGVVAMAALGLTLGACATKKAAEAPPHASPTPAATATPTPTLGGTPPKPKKGIFAQILTGFGLKELIFPPKKEVPKALPAHLVGTVKLVNKEEKFVLIDTLTAGNVAAGDHLLCIMNERQTASLKMTSLRNPPFLIADITDGAPEVGDRVYAP